MPTKPNIEIKWGKTFPDSHELELVVLHEGMLPHIAGTVRKNYLTGHYLGLITTHGEAEVFNTLSECKANVEKRFVASLDKKIKEGAALLKSQKAVRAKLRSMGIK